MSDLSHDIILGMDWLKLTNPVIDWVACSLDILVGNNLYILLTFTVNNVANVTLSSMEQVLVDVKYSFLAWFGMLHPH